MKLELKTNALSVHSNLVGVTHGHLGILMTDAKYAIMSNKPYVYPTHPGILLLSENSTRVASYELRHIYDEKI